jgi:outer membrane lipopolysaccharide assembly protein LptE/RlpB
VRPAFVVGAWLLLLSGCGYTTKSLLPAELKSIYVENFVNKISMSDPTSDVRMYTGYRPRLEYEVTKAIVDRFLFDGNLRVSREQTADLILRGALVDFRKEPLRYDRDNNVEEYRVRLVADIELKDAKHDTLLWKEKGFAGESTYRTTGSLAKSESAALEDAKTDLARRIVERTIEGW